MEEWHSGARVVLGGTSMGAAIALVTASENQKLVDASDKDKGRSDGQIGCKSGNPEKATIDVGGPGPNELTSSTDPTSVTPTTSSSSTGDLNLKKSKYQLAPLPIRIVSLLLISPFLGVHQSDLPPAPVVWFLKGISKIIPSLPAITPKALDSSI